MTVYELFLGRAVPDEVLRATTAGDPQPSELKGRLFYAHLYLGLWDEANDRRPECLAQLKKAIEQQDRGGYMWQVAKVHVRLREMSE